MTEIEIDVIKTLIEKEKEYKINPNYFESNNLKITN